MDIILGVDGGGTKTSILAIDTTGKEIASAKGGSINYNFISMDEAVNNLIATIQTLNIKNANIVAISIGNPAMDDITKDNNTEIFEKRIKEKLINTKVYMKSDAFMALYGLTNGDAGTLLISGTGSMGIAIDKEHKVYIVGGWGRPTCDNGSGYDIAVNGFKSAFSAYDKIGKDTMLIKAACEYYNISSLRDIIPILNDRKYRKSDIAMFAKVVSECASLGDSVAISILDSATKRLVDYTVSLINSIKEEDCAVGIYGGVFQNNEYIREKYCLQVKEKFPKVNIKIPDMPPEKAAALYALRSKNE